MQYLFFIFNFWRRWMHNMGERGRGHRGKDTSARLNGCPVSLPQTCLLPTIGSGAPQNHLCPSTNATKLHQKQGEVKLFIWLSQGHTEKEFLRSNPAI